MSVHQEQEAPPSRHWLRRSPRIAAFAARGRRRVAARERRRRCSGPFTRFGGYSDTFPAGGYTTQLSIYLDTVWASTHADRRFDWDVASSNSSGGFRRDFAFNAGTTPTASLSAPATTPAGQAPTRRAPAAPLWYDGRIVDAVRPE
jgi:hypothetical protein